MGSAPGSKPDAMSEKVATAYNELKTGIDQGSVEKAMSDINNMMHDLSPKDWSRFTANLSRKVNTTANMLPELSILATENSLAEKLENGTITDNDVNARITADQGASVQNQNKTPFEEGLLQSFVQNEYNTAKNESGGRFANSVSTSDLNKDLDDKKSTTAALAQLAKNNFASFSQLAGSDGNEITRDSIEDALARDKSRVAGGLSPTLDAATRDIANKLDNDDALFGRLGQSSAADRITMDDMNTEMRNEHANPVQFQKADKEPTKGASDSATNNATTGKHPGKPGEGQGHQPGSEGQHPSNPEHGKLKHVQPHNPGGEGQEPGNRNHGAAHAQATEGGGGTHPGSETKSHHRPADEHGHTVQRGENLWQIARHHLIREGQRPTITAIEGLIQDIVANNGIKNPDYIRDGQVLQI